MITWRGCEESCQGFKTSLESLHPGAVVELRDAGQKRATVAAFVAEAKQTRPDVIVTWGGDATLEVVGPYDEVDPERHITDLPVVYMYVSSAPELRIARSEWSTGRRNVAGTDYAVPLSAQVTAMRNYKPFRKMGMLYDDRHMDSVARVQKMRELAEEMHYQLVALPLIYKEDGPDESALPQLIGSLKEMGAEFIHFGVSSTLINWMEPFTAAAKSLDIPVFSGGQMPVKRAHALLALYTPISEIGALAAYQVAHILESPGRSLADLPTARFVRHSLAINMRVAREMGLYPPMSMVRIADLVE